MAIEIPGDVFDAVADLKSIPKNITDLDVLCIIEAALPHLIPAITADLRAQLQDRFLELDGKLFDVEEPDNTGAIAIRPMVEFDGWCAMQALEEAFDRLAGMEGDDATK